MPRPRRHYPFYLLLFLSLAFLTITWHRLTPTTLHTPKTLKSYEPFNPNPFSEPLPGLILTDPHEIEENEKLFRKFGLFVKVSDKIPLNRTVPDFRRPECLKIQYPVDLPRVSIIIIFNDETESVFKRTLHSLYDRTPHELIEEIVLVDDFSQKGFYGENLTTYIQSHFFGLNFNILRLIQRCGLAKARTIGAENAKSEFLFFMEPHCEMTYNWLPPLIEPVLENQKTVTVPIVDNIEYVELSYYENDRGNLGSRGVFDWDLNYQKLKRFPVSEGREVEPFLTPIMTGGIFMIRRKYFFSIGGYDDQLRIWGAENIEMSLKIHLCGGRLMEVPCSHIGHMFRAFTTSRRDKSGSDFETFNRKRIVEVWFDDYKKFVYNKNKEKYEKIGDVGSLVKAKIQRRKMQCKNFEFFIKEIAPDLTEKFPFESPPFASGLLMTEKGNLCVKMGDFDDVSGNAELGLSDCDSGADYFELSWYRDVRTWGGAFCIDAFDLTKISSCHMQGGNQLFQYFPETHLLINLYKFLCLEANPIQKTLKMSECNEENSNQKWIFSEFINETALNDWEGNGRKINKSNPNFFE